MDRKVAAIAAERQAIQDRLDPADGVVNAVALADANVRVGLAQLLVQESIEQQLTRIADALDRISARM